MKTPALVLLSVLLLLSAAHAAPKGKSTSAVEQFRVRPFVSLQTAEQSTIKQCVFRELRKIPEVIVVEDDSKANRFQISVAIVTNETTNGTRFGYSAAVVVYTPIGKEFIQGLLRDDLNKDFFAEGLSAARFTDDMYVITDSDLSSLCRRVVAKFDTEQVERIRQAAQKSQ